MVAEKLEREFKKNIKNYLPSINVVVPGKGQTKEVRPAEDAYEQVIEEIPYQEKMKLTQRMRFLNQEELGVVVEMIKACCPEAYRELEAPKAQLLIDQLDIETFDKLNEQIDLLAQKHEK